MIRALGPTLGFAALLAVTAVAPVSASTALQHLMTVEDRCEAIAESGTSPAAARRLARIAVDAWPATRKALGARAPAAALAATDAAMATLRDELASGTVSPRAANEVTGAAASLFTVAGDVVPASVHRLDYLGRTISIDVRHRDWARAALDRRRLDDTWKREQSRLAAHNAASRRAALQLAGAVTSVDQAVANRDGRAVTVALRAVNDGVDRMENAFAP